jgi:hypothetical protein
VTHIVNHRPHYVRSGIIEVDNDTPFPIFITIPWPICHDRRENLGAKVLGTKTSSFGENFNEAKPKWRPENAEHPSRVPDGLRVRVGDFSPSATHM